MTHLIDLKNFTLPELEQILAAWGQPAFRARQLVKWLYKGVRDFDAMSDIARPFRAELSRQARISSFEPEQVQEGKRHVLEIYASVALQDKFYRVEVPKKTTDSIVHDLFVSGLEMERLEGLEQEP